MTNEAAPADAAIEARINARFAEAAALEADGAFDAAFAAFEEANARRRAHLDADGFAAQHVLLAENLEWLFGPDVFARHHDDGDPTRAPIFIVGMPRSGSTLIEQILDTHSKVQGMGEVDWFRLNARTRYPFPGTQPGPRHFRELAAEYLGGVRALGWRDARHFADKQLYNYGFIGMIRLAFPRATILHSVRDPIDTCVSSFRANFAPSAVTWASFSLADIGSYYRRYRRIMAHWEKVLPGAVIPVDYEALVADFPAQARALIEACGLRWEERCLRFFENPREVLTVSRDQVKRPIFNDSIGRWRDYQVHLGPLFEALGQTCP